MPWPKKYQCADERLKVGLIKGISLYVFSGFQYMP